MNFFEGTLKTNAWLINFNFLSINQFNRRNTNLVIFTNNTCTIRLWRNIYYQYYPRRFTFTVDFCFSFVLCNPKVIICCVFIKCYN
ncbi:hypothetical protein EDC39_102201 [Geothermobacter ehrlichii]|uniref:Uncharacterized protein n=1 Tax=Geothermobacter ehrlichii TaxID=213224 RepID=A0A5D3WMT0_9BACT|nr:hypothetical protein EDC39_102201 [Geothermobacter ehrlichii]